LSNTEDAKRIEDTKNQEHYINAIVKWLLSYTSR
jgi:N-acetylmuramoyl-L-alanine amidase